MMRRRLTKILAVGCVLTMMMGTAVMAETSRNYNFRLPAGNSAQTSTVRKQTNGSAYVERTGPAGATTVLTVNMCNGAGTIKSSRANIAGIGHTYLSYAGYNVSAGDDVALQGTNNVAQNGGRSIEVTGIYRP